MLKTKIITGWGGHLFRRFSKPVLPVFTSLLVTKFTTLTAAAMLPKQARGTFRKHVKKPSEQVAAPPSRTTTLTTKKKFSSFPPLSPLFMAILWLLAMLGCVRSSPHEQRLIKDLMRDYNTLERPVANESEALVLKLGLTLQQISAVDEKNQLLTTNVWLKLEWKDVNMRWNKSEFLALKHESRILGHSSNPVCGFSMMEQVRLCVVQAYIYGIRRDQFSREEAAE